MFIEGKEKLSSFVLGFGDYLSYNANRMSGKDLCDLYFEFTKLMKRSIGSSSNFTGMSEYLVFHTVKGLLNNEFESVPIRKMKGTKDDELIRYMFINKENEIILGHEIPFFKDGTGMSQTVNRNTFCPDISIQKGGILTHIIEIKVFLRGQGITDIVKRYRSIKTAYNNIKILVVILIRGSKRSDITLEKISKESNFSFIFLSDISTPIQNVLLPFLSN